MEKIWLNPEFLDWIQFESSGAYLSDEYLRSYEMLSYAEKCLTEDPSDTFSRSNCVTWLKRSINKRIQLLEYIYSFQGLIDKKVKGSLQTLELFGLIKPIMLKNLLRIRNEIEHEDLPPPEISSCQELVEFVWYFLRSTDDASKNLKDTIEFVNPDFYGTKEEYSFNIETKFDLPPSFEFSGDLASSDYVKEAKANWPLLEITHFRNESENNKRIFLRGFLQLNDDLVIVLTKSLLGGRHV